MCVQPASRNTHGFVNGSPPPIPRLDLEEKENYHPVMVVGTRRSAESL